ncbi:hypothetical protein [Pseudactinotalea sp. HY160]|uniref:hypothetical protein n=1 Tax=Pseudactinotalea sp. HY160 TaxID=2654490 RepID=UPI00128CB201|nr:hypothetical protein [Pseudactinotalea sp. HY160]
MTTTRATPSRQPAGTPVGGQFAAQAKPAADVCLDGSDRPESSHEQVAGAAIERIMALEAASAPGVKAQTFAAARGMAAIARSQWPEAATIKTRECDQIGCTRQHAEEVLDADGNELGQMYELEDYEQDLIDMESGLSPVLGQDVFSASYSRHDGEHGAIDIDEALKPSHQEDTPADRAGETISGYRARFDDLDLDDRTVARDMLTDLHHWARSKGVDLDEVMASAREVADEEIRGQQ